MAASRAGKACVEISCPCRYTAGPCSELSGAGAGLDLTQEQGDVGKMQIWSWLYPVAVNSPGCCQGQGL